MNNGFHTFVDGFNANFATIANVMVEENLREKMASERMKDVIAELMNLSLPSGDVFKAANIFTADKDKINVLFNLPSELRRNYVVNLLIPSPSSISSRPMPYKFSSCAEGGREGWPKPTSPPPANVVADEPNSAPIPYVVSATYLLRSSRNPSLLWSPWQRQLSVVFRIANHVGLLEAGNLIPKPFLFLFFR
ncbi:hypothetical protein ZIOFF_057080 [Zingiber officinale]|uniref:MLLE-like domain-containing protein n=1 Tax=Zingiber officinale TaxID=94328 RepID=A0A8J5KFT2_ZINOF|nr:hypothetical protein ZIOFF_057080 [Zingiber officinale]